MRYHTAIISLALVLMIATTTYATQAICLNCGAIHFGAIVPCDSCGFAPMPIVKKDGGMFQVFVLFSDHHIGLSSLENLGGVVKKLKPVFPDFYDRLWALLYYLAKKHPYSGLVDNRKFKLPDSLQTTIPDEIEKLDVPTFRIKGRFGSLGEGK